MAYNFYVRQLDRTGTLKRAAVTDFLSLSYSRVLNTPGTLTMLYNFDNIVVQNLSPFDLFEVYWKNDAFGVPWHLDFEGVYRDISIATDLNGITQAVLTCPAQMSILNYRYISYPSGTVDRSTFRTTPAETVMKTIVDYNTTSLATTVNGRIRDGDLEPGMGFTIVSAPDSGLGNVLSRSFSNKKLLPTLTDLAEIAGGDFSLTRTPVIGNGARWVFEFHTPQLGDDKTSGSDQVEFSLSRANMKNPKLAFKRRGEVTVGVSGGQGVGDQRRYVSVLGANYAADNDIEVYFDARNEGDSASVTDAALSKLNSSNKADVAFDFDVIQTDAVFFSPVPVTGKKTYKEGDLVLSRYAGFTFTRQVKAINVAVRPNDSSGPVEITVETEQFI